MLQLKDMQLLHVRSRKGTKATFHTTVITNNRPFLVSNSFPFHTSTLYIEFSAINIAEERDFCKEMEADI
jgi:hypothetical protein